MLDSIPGWDGVKDRVSYEVKSVEWFLEVPKSKIHIAIPNYN
jgi:hypothetical protein